MSLDVRAGEVLAIVGESGSGKTVTARSILGLLPETARVDGVVLLGKDDIVTVDETRLRELRGTEVAMIFQEPSSALNPVYTVGWQLAEGLRAHGNVTPGGRPGRAPSRCWHGWASRIRLVGSTTTRTSSRAARSSASSSRWRSPSLRR